MTPHPSKSPSNPALPELPQTFERRAFVRYPRRLEMLWQFLGIVTPDLASATVFDLSVTGLGLLVEREFSPGAILVLRLPTLTQGWNTHLVRVRHCRKQADGKHQVGCAFVRRLTAERLQAILGRADLQG